MAKSIQRVKREFNPSGVVINIHFDRTGEERKTLRDMSLGECYDLIAHYADTMKRIKLNRDIVSKHYEQISDDIDFICGEGY